MAVSSPLKKSRSILTDAWGGSSGNPAKSHLLVVQSTSKLALDTDEIGKAGPLLQEEKSNLNTALKIHPNVIKEEEIHEGTLGDLPNSSNGGDHSSSKEGGTLGVGDPIESIVSLPSGTLSGLDNYDDDEEESEGMDSHASTVDEVEQQENSLNPPTKLDTAAVEENCPSKAPKGKARIMQINGSITNRADDEYSKCGPPLMYGSNSNPTLLSQQDSVGGASGFITIVAPSSTTTRRSALVSSMDTIDDVVEIMAEASISRIPSSTMLQRRLQPDKKGTKREKRAKKDAKQFPPPRKQKVKKGRMLGMLPSDDADGLIRDPSFVSKPMTPTHSNRASNDKATGKDTMARFWRQ